QSIIDHLSSSIVRSHRHLDSLFSTTYGTFYEKHTKIFADLFSDLRSESLNDEVSISDVVIPFYRRLFRVVFSLFNPMQFVGVDEADCMGLAMDEVAPFGDIPKRSIVHLERTLQGWRQLILALQTTYDALDKFTNATLSPMCIDALTKMTVCPSCESETPMKACRATCESTLSSCLSDWQSLDGQWNTLVGWLRRLSLRLREAYSLSATLDALPAMISEAIMHFQERGDAISNKVAAKCFMTEERLRRMLRENGGRRWKRSIGEEGKRLSLRQITVEAESHQRATIRMVEHLFEKLGSMRGFFSSLHKDVCAMDKVSAEHGEKCWDNSGEVLRPLKRESDSLSSSFVHEGVRFGLLSFRIATFIYGKNYTGYTIEGSGSIIDDEDYWESSGDDVSILQLDRPSQPDIKVHPPSR
ncbi:hypothetical protein PMAYCL1PPCAC_02167, partial [Pristionchus mayeri]